MNVKDKLLKVVKSRKSIRTLAAALALTTTLSGCAFFKGNDNIPEEPTVSYEQNIDDEHNHTHEHEDEPSVTPIIPNTIIDEEPGETDKKDEEPVVEEKDPLAELGITIDADGHYVINGLVIPDLSNSSYKGVSIVDALYKEGYRYDREYLHALAEHFGIENYRGTAEQNTLLLKYLRTWVIELGLTQLKPQNPTNTDKPINQGTTTTDPTDPTPAPTDPTINEDHVHLFGEWYSINDLLEEATCECGEKEYRAHKYGWTDWIQSDDATMEVKTGTCLNCGHVVTQSRPLPTPEHRHEFGEWTIVKEPTCTEEGISERTCLECGEKEARVIPKSEHKFGGWSAWTPWSTPDENNIQTRTRTKTCRTCGEEVTETQTRTYTPPQPGHTHNWIGWTVEQQPTCTEEGLKVNYCRKCGEKITQSIAALGHSFSEWGIVKEATYDEEGLKTRTCSVCGEKEQEVIPKKQRPEHTHTWSEWNQTKTPTCTDAGEETRTCACGETEQREIPALGHSFGEWVTVKEATYDEEGLKTRTCSVCGTKEQETIPKKQKPSHTHTWSEWSQTKVPTCETPGEETRTCACGETEQREIPALGHDLKETITKQPTCTENGEKTISCSRGDYSETEVIPALGHSFGEWTVVKEPTETEEGLRERTCSLCGEKEQEVIPALGHEHQWGAWTVTKAATCTEEGIETRTCQSGHTETRTIPALGHDKTTVVVDPTCTTQGSTTTTCSRCDLNEITTTPALGHDHGEYTVVKDATCSEEGLEEASCSRCGNVISRVIAKLAHVMGITSQADATCTQGGHTTETCANCGHTETQTVDALGHDYVRTQTGSQENVDDDFNVISVTYTYVETCSRCGDSKAPVTETVPVNSTPAVTNVEVKQELAVPVTDVLEQLGEGPDPKDDATKLGVDVIDGTDATLNDEGVKLDTDEVAEGEDLTDENGEDLEADDSQKLGTEGLPADGENLLADEPKEGLGDLEEAYNEYVELVTGLQEADTTENTYSEGGMSLTLTPEA